MPSIASTYVHISLLNSSCGLCLTRFRELKRSHEKAMEDMTAEMEAKERAHAQEINSLERKFLTEKSAMEKARHD